MTRRTAHLRRTLVAALIAAALLGGATLPAGSQQPPSDYWEVPPPTSPIKPPSAAPWDLDPWTSVGFVAVVACAALAWRMAGRGDAPADPEPPDRA